MDRWKPRLDGELYAVGAKLVLQGLLNQKMAEQIFSNKKVCLAGKRQNHPRIAKKK